ncbi:hypothetical protein [Laspinema palackyanum]|uniref:hypothetical protein n=1 Tax=Laspinema palackyanum TaxID=3231601 RepID=UPI00345C854A|nr:hypothetical protein [Laspinema sp. D2c]
MTWRSPRHAQLAAIAPVVLLLAWSTAVTSTLELKRLLLNWRQSLMRVRDVAIATSRGND